MLSQQPHVPRLSDRLLWWLRHRISIGILWRQLLDLRQQVGQLFIAEPDQAQVEVLLRQVLQLTAQQVRVPPSIQRQLVVRKDVGLPLALTQVVEHHHRHRLQPQLLRS